MSSSLSKSIESKSIESKSIESKSIESSNIKTTAPYKLIQSKNFNECGFLINMISERCTLGADFAIARTPENGKQTCEDISLILERCILDGHDCKTNLYKFNVLCKGDVDTKLE